MAAMKIAVAFALLFAIVAKANEFVGGDVVHLTSSNYDDTSLSFTEGVSGTLLALAPHMQGSQP
eukprot:scaffold17966_cov16-Tisochrysis_lutea.AAC.1